MTTLVERAKTVHRRGVINAAKQTVTFHRSSDNCTITNAIGYETLLQFKGPDNLPVHVLSMVWLLPQDEVLINSVAVEPQMNDQIEDADGNIFEPFRPQPDIPAVVAHCGSEFWQIHSERRVTA